MYFLSAIIYYFLAELVLVCGAWRALGFAVAIGGVSINFRGVAKVASIRAATKWRRLSICSFCHWRQQKVAKTGYRSSER